MRPLTRRLVISFFLLAITLPAVSILLPIKSPEVENRLISAPEFSASRLIDPAFYREVLRYTSDANPVRALLIDVGTGLDYNLFGDSPNPNAVLLGMNGWLYGRKAIGSLCQSGSPSASVQELLDVVAFLRAQGIDVIFTVAPAKFAIHSENLTGVQSELAQCAQQTSRLLRMELSATADSGYIDSWALFENIKSRGDPSYFRTDTHFNHTASIVWMEAIVTRIEPRIWQDSAVRSREESFFIGNLMKLIGRREVESVYEMVVDRGFSRRPSEQLHTPFSETETATQRFLAVASGSRPLIDGRVFVLKDSFMDISAPSLAQYFKDVTFTDWRSEESVRYFVEQSPSADIVIIETSEEDLLNRFGDKGLLSALRDAAER